MTTPRDDIAGLSERLTLWVTDWDGSQMVDGEPPRDGIHCDILREAAAKLDAIRNEINDWANEVARYKGYAEKFDEENAALSARVKELEAARMGQIDYSVDLQRIIEGLCRGRTIREPQTGARHHYDMAIEYQARATRAEQERDEALERAAGVADNAELISHDPGECRALIVSAIRRLAAGPEKEKRE